MVQPPDAEFYERCIHSTQVVCTIFQVILIIEIDFLFDYSYESNEVATCALNPSMLDLQPIATKMVLKKNSST